MNDILNRFWSKVAEPVDAHNDCWIWKAFRNPKGYGMIRTKRPRRMILAHRFVYEQFYGPIPEGSIIHHNCKNPSCVNPTHLELDTNGGHSAYHNTCRPRKEVCSHGHKYVPSNTYIDRSALEVANEALGKALECIIELRRQFGAERRYIEALEGQLEPSVIEEIKAELEAQAQEEASQIERK